MIDDKSKFELRHVLYCDLLGFSKYTQSEFFEPEKCFQLFSQLDQLVTEASREIDESTIDERTGHLPDYVIKPEAIYCSDSIVISTPSTNVDAIWLCEAAAMIQNGICAHGFMLRGAIVTGYLYHAGNTIFGPAIVKAVELEKKGDHPIIVVDEGTLEIFTHADSEEDREITKIRKQQLVVHEDGCLPHIDPFWLAKMYVNNESIPLKIRAQIDSWRALIERGLSNNTKTIFDKYFWIAKRFNQSLCAIDSTINPIAIKV